MNQLFALLLSLTGAFAIDGDTFDVNGDRYRIWGIDAPERSEVGGSEATRMLRDLIRGQSLDCTMIDRDPYGRSVVRCILPQGADIACEMVRSGHAVDWPRYSNGYYAECDR